MSTPQETVERALALSTADDCIVIAEEGSSANLRWANSTLTTNGVTRSRDLTVIAIVDGPGGRSVGSVSRSNVRDDELESLVRRAEHTARENGRAEDDRPLVQPDGDDPGWPEPPAETGIGVFEGFAPALGEALAAARGNDRALYGFAEHVLTSSYLGTSTGVRRRHDQPTGKVELTGKSADHARSAWAGQATRDFTDVDVAALDADVRRRLDWARRRIDLGPGRYETLLPPSAVADLMVYLYWTAGARDAAEGRTVFRRTGGGTRVGEAIANLPVDLRSDPHAPGLQAAPFVLTGASGDDVSVFDNGMPVGPTHWIREGTLASLASSRHTADLAALPVTPAADNLILERSDRAGRSLEEMVAATERGLLLTCMWYIREVDPETLLLTGLTRDGVFLVEGGEVAGAVTNFRWNESPVDLLGRLDEVGRSEITLPREWNDWFTRTAMPALRVPDFNMSTVSQAS